MTRLTFTSTFDKHAVFLLDSSYLYLDIMAYVGIKLRLKAVCFGPVEVTFKKSMTPKKALQMDEELQKNGTSLKVTKYSEGDFGAIF